MQIDCLKLQVSGEGTVWFGDDSRVAVDSRRDPADFLDHYHDLYADALCIRVLGRADNALLISQLHEHRARAAAAVKPTLPRVQLGSPMICPGSRPAADVLACVWHAGKSADVIGNWYEMNQTDYTAYALVAAMREAGGPCDKARRIMLYHPAWPAMSFAGVYCDVDACCSLLRHVVDVRWFMHPAKPHRCTKLFAFLGLTPANARAAVSGKPGGHHADRADVTFRSWLGFPPSILPTRGLKSLSDRDFLRRVYLTRDDPAAGLLAATRKYVQFVREVWTAERAGQPDHFDPEMFFYSHEEVAAYLEHRRNLSAEAGIAPS